MIKTRIKTRKVFSKFSYLSEAASVEIHSKGPITLASGHQVNSVLVLDIDSTLADTRPWFESSITALLPKLAFNLGLTVPELGQAFADVAKETTLHEYAYVVETIADRWSRHLKLSPNRINLIADEFWTDFNALHQHIKPYPGLGKTLKLLTQRYPDMAIVALTDAPIEITATRLQILGVLQHFDGIVAVESEPPQLQNKLYDKCVKHSQKRFIEAEANLKHKLQLKVSVLCDHAKPSDLGLGIIIEWLGLAPNQVIICGDKETKEGLAAKNWHKSNPKANGQITFLRALYGQAGLMDPKYIRLGNLIPTMMPSLPKQDPQDPIAIHADLNKVSELAKYLRRFHSSMQTRSKKKKAA